METTLKVLALVATLTGGVIAGLYVPVYLSPSVVYDDFESETIFGQTVQEEIAKALQRHLFSGMISGMQKKPPQFRPTPGQDPVKQAADVMWTWQKSLMKSALQPKSLFPDTYYRVRVRNIGKRPADDLSVVLAAPGVIIDSHVSKSGCDISPRFAKILDNTVPTTLMLDKREIGHLRPEEEIIVEVWYAKRQVNKDYVPGMPEALTVGILSERGRARRVDATTGSDDRHGLSAEMRVGMFFFVATLLVGCIALFLAALVAHSRQRPHTESIRREDIESH